jgi:hypothetical protein
MLQQGYAFGYLLAVVFARALVDTVDGALSSGSAQDLLFCLLHSDFAFRRHKHTANVKLYANREALTLVVLSLPRERLLSSAIGSF